MLKIRRDKKNSEINSFGISERLFLFFKKGFFYFMETLLEAIGNTPLIELKRSLPEASARVFAKLEKFNPGGSSKDRVILKILDSAEKSGALIPGQTIVAATTGNSGIALGYLGNIKKYPIILTMPENFSLERRRILESYGVTLHLTPAAEDMKGAISLAKKIAREKNAFFLDQFENPQTVLAHQEGTFEEIKKELPENIDAFVCGVGTGGTLMGIGKALKNRGTRIYAIEPTSSPWLSQGKTGPHKIQGIGPGFVPKILDRSIIDEVISITDREAYEGAQDIAKHEGLLVGISCGAAFVGAKRIAQKLGTGKIVLTTFPDGGERYFSMKKFFNEESLS